MKWEDDDECGESREMEETVWYARAHEMLHEK
jgi:hypothetical protein